MRLERRVASLWALVGRSLCFSLKLSGTGFVEAQFEQDEIEKAAARFLAVSALW